jgi:hypothetical protein
MAVRATISKGYIWRPGVIGAMMLLFSGWFCYDGFVKYPLQQEIWGSYNQVVVDNPGDPIEQARLWAEHAGAKGWPTDTPKKKVEDKDILTQKIIAAITAPVGIYFLATFILTRGRWVEADEQGVRISSGQQMDYASIKSIDKSRWQRKGIALVHYESNGQAGRILLDDWKYDREPTKRILEVIEERMPGGGGGEDGDDAGVADDDTES